MSNAIEDFLNSPFREFYLSGDDSSFRAWLRQAIFAITDEKRAAGCDSGWQRGLYEALVRVDPKIADPDLVARRDAALQADDWDTFDALDIKIDYGRADAAFRDVITYILTPR